MLLSKLRKKGTRMSIIEASILLIALSFAIASIFLIILFVKTSRTLTCLQKELMTTHDLLQNTTKISTDFYDKMKCLNPFFHAAHHIGQELEYKTRLSKRHSEDVGSMDLINWALLGIQLWNNYKKKD